MTTDPSYRMNLSAQTVLLRCLEFVAKGNSRSSGPRSLSEACPGKIDVAKPRENVWLECDGI